MQIYLIIAARNLLQSGRRTFLLGFALALVTMFLMLLLALSTGVNRNLVEAATTLSAGHINVSGFFKTTPVAAAPIVIDAPRVRKIVEENTPGLAHILDRQRGWGKVVSDTSTIQSALIGVDLKEEQRLLKTLILAEEREYKEGGRAEVLGDFRELNAPGTAVIFVNQAKRLEVGVGDMLTLRIETMRGMTNTMDVRVVAVARDVGLLSAWRVFLRKSSLTKLYNLRPDTTGAIQVYLHDIERAPEVMKHLYGVLEKEGYIMMDHEPQPFFMKFQRVAGEDWTGQKIDLTIWRDEVSLLTWVVTALDMVSFILISILVVIIAAGIANTMWIAVRERTNEIGTMRAIGMHRSRVGMVFLLEALILGLVATTLGALVGAGIALAVDAAEIQINIQAVQAILLSDKIHLVVEPEHVIRSIFAFTLLTGVAAMWPSYKASRMQPVTAMHKIV